MNGWRRAAFVLALVLFGVGCGPRAVLFVDVTGSVNTASGPVDALRVTVHHVRLGRDLVLRQTPGAAANRRADLGAVHGAR